VPHGSPPHLTCLDRCVDASERVTLVTCSSARSPTPLFRADGPLWGVGSLKRMWNNKVTTEAPRSTFAAPRSFEGTQNSITTVAWYQTRAPPARTPVFSLQGDFPWCMLNTCTARVYVLLVMGNRWYWRGKRRCIFIPLLPSFHIVSLGPSPPSQHSMTILRSHSSILFCAIRMVTTTLIPNLRPKRNDALTASTEYRLQVPSPLRIVPFGRNRKTSPATCSRSGRIKYTQG